MSHHTLLHRSLRPAVRVLAASPITPDQVTVVRLLTGLAAALCVAQGAAGLPLGGALFLASAVLDRLDGALARWTRTFSALGSRFDLIADCASAMSFFIGLGIGVAADPLPAALTPLLSPVLGISAAFGVAVLFWHLNSGSQGLHPTPVRLFDPDDVMLLLPVPIWCGLGGTILLLAGIVTPIAAAVHWWIARRARSPRAGGSDA
jgi:phosphatidylglycerophosphate synthase